MSSTSYERLEDVVLDEAFPEVDLCLRRGRHIDRDDPSLYTLLVDAQALLETLYRRFGCELVHKTDGYFYLLPTRDRLGRGTCRRWKCWSAKRSRSLLDPHTVEGWRGHARAAPRAARWRLGCRLAGANLDPSAANRRARR